MSGEFKAGARRGVLSWPVFGLTLGALIAGTGAAQAGGPVLPTGGKVVSGSAAIGAPGAGALTVTQSSSKAILDWSSFSIGAGGKVTFDNGSGATLNRVTGASLSSLDGLLSATGSVYLINPNGVIIGKSGVLDVGGTFVASTLDTPDASFLKGGALGFSGPSTASVVNLGKVGALGGDVALIAAQVSNAGSISAANGSAGLIAGHSVVMLRDGALDEGRFSVLLGGADTSVTNAGLIHAADAELRAEGGNVYALAGDTSGVIRATGVKSGGGKVWLVAEGGELDLGGAITAQGAGGTAGVIETSGSALKIGSVRIDARGGTWLVDPDDLTIDTNAATAIDSALNAGTSVTEQTTASGYSGAGVVGASGKGDITVAAPISWGTTAGLTLSAYRNINVDAQVTASGGGALTLVTDNSGAGNGGALLFNGGSVQFTGAGGGQPTGALVIGVGTGAPVNYTLVSDLQTLSADIVANNSGAFALAKSIDGSNGGAGYTKIPLISTSSTPFTGRFEGLGNTILNLEIEDSTDSYAGLFGRIDTSGVVTDLGLTGQVSASYGGTTYAGGLVGESYGSLSGIQSAVNVTSGYDAGGVAGVSYGSVSYSSSSGSIVGGEAGGLVGFAAGTISHASSSAKVVGQGDADAGGLVAFNIGRISESFSTGSVTGPLSDGGLVGFNDGGIDSSYSTASVYSGDGSGGLAGVSMGPITRSYASGPVSGYATGGLVGQNINSGTVSNSYFDSQTTGQTSDGGGATGLTTAQFMNASSPISNLGLSATPGGSGFVIVDSDGTLNGTNGATRPILLSEYSTTITNAHQLQLVALNLSATYTLAANVDASGTSNPSDVWGPAGFVPVGQASAPFTGTLNGAGHTVTSLTINDVSGTDVGLIGDLGAGGVVESLILSGNVTGGTNVGALVGYNSGMVTGSSGKGSVSGASNVGGVVGYNSALVSGSYGKATVSGTGTANASPSQNVGGFVGLNSGSLTGDYATGAVTGEGSVGGLAGSNTGTISKSYATGAVSSVSGKSFLQNGLGGLVGSNSATLTDDYATGAVAGNEQVGGLVGYNSSSGVISVAYATGAVKGLTGNGAPSGSGVDVGGLVGQNAGSAANTYATGAVSGSSGKGGLVGVNDQGATVATSYATGKAGFGFAGANNGTLVSDVFDTNTTGTSTGVGSGSGTGVTGIGGSTGLDPDQASSYSGFDFTSIWAIQPGSSRPYLMAIPQSAPPT